LDLFSGIGGFALAAKWAGIQTIGFSEIDPFCCELLAKRFPGIPNFGDIRNVKGESIGHVDLITGGFPCQPFSVAGDMRGTSDERYLWPEVVRLAGETRPDFVIGENVGNSLKMLINDIEDSLVSIGYEIVQILDTESDAFGAPTMERHIWYIAASTGIGRKRLWETKVPDIERMSREFQGSYQGRFQRRCISESRFCRVGERVSARLDKTGRDRLRALGNAIDPQVVYPIMKGIKELTKNESEN
jgi:DNA (cytosine-5)-methyltransferase 1